MRNIYFLRKYLVSVSYFSLIDRLVFENELVKRVTGYKSWCRVIGGQVGIRKFKIGCLLVRECGLGVGFGWARTRKESERREERKTKSACREARMGLLPNSKLFYVYRCICMYYHFPLKACK
jgi:hypothetical protein